MKTVADFVKHHRLFFAVWTVWLFVNLVLCSVPGWGTAGGLFPFGTTDDWSWAELAEKWDSTELLVYGFGPLVAFLFYRSLRSGKAVTIQPESRDNFIPREHPRTKSSRWLLMPSLALGLLVYAGWFRSPEKFAMGELLILSLSILSIVGILCFVFLQAGPPSNRNSSGNGPR